MGNFIKEMMIITHGYTYRTNVFKKTISNFYTSYQREMELVPIKRDYWVLLYDAFKFSLEGRQHVRFYLTLILSVQTSKFDNEIVSSSLKLSGF